MEENKLSQADYDSLVRPYEDALNAIRIRMDGLNTDYQRLYQNCPIHHIQERIKAKASIESKLQKHKLPVSIENAKDTLTDIAGLRVICYFTEDVYSLARQMKKQADLVLIKETDYIKSPKTNGYKSYHLVLGVPVYNIDGFQYYPVELQIRSMTMDLWASMEHRICYKHDETPNYIASVHFKKYLELLDQMESELKQMV